jgi:hypothetical protein
MIFVSASGEFQGNMFKHSTTTSFSVYVCDVFPLLYDARSAPEEK